MNPFLLAIFCTITLLSCSKKKEQTTSVPVPVAEVEKSSDSSIKKNTTAETMVFLTGTINDKYPITMVLQKSSDSTIVGTYAYTGRGKQSYLELNGIGSLGDSVSLIETDGKTETGRFVGVIRGDSLVGSWRNKTMSLPFALKKNKFTKTTVLSSAIGTYHLNAISGSVGANGMFDFGKENGVWYAGGSSINGGMREGYDVDVTHDDSNLFNSIAIEVDSLLSVKLMVSGSCILTIPFTATKTDFAISNPEENKFWLEYTYGEKIQYDQSTLWGFGYTGKNILIISARDNADFTEQITISSEMFEPKGLMILTYQPVTKSFDLQFHSNWSHTTFTFVDF